MRGTTVLPRTPCLRPKAGELPLHRLEVRAPDVLPFAVGTFDTIGPLSRAAFPHRHTFYEIVFVTGGTGDHVVDFTRWEVAPPQLAVITPGQVHHWDAHALSGHVVLFTDDFLLDHPADRETLRRLSEQPWRLDERAAEKTAWLVTELDVEFRRGGQGTDSVLRALMHVLIVRAGRLSGLADLRPPAGHRRWERSSPGC